MNWGEDAEKVWMTRDNRSGFRFPVGDFDRSVIELYQLYELSLIRRRVLEVCEIDIYEIPFEDIRWKVGDLRDLLLGENPREDLEVYLTVLVL